MTLRLRGGQVVVSLDPPLVRDGDVLVEGGRIAAVGGPAADGPVIDVSGCLVVPGNVNAHMHAYSALARGMPYRLVPPADFVQILQRVWWRLDRALDEQAIRASALAAGREALLSGTTTLIDHHASPMAVGGSLDVLAGAFAELGLRAVLAYEVSDRDGQAVAAAGLAENRRFLGRVAAGELPLARGMVGGHASFTLSDETVADLAALEHDYRAGLHIHVAEDLADQRDCLALHGERVVRRLDEAGLLDERTLLAHAVHLDPSEAEIVRASGATVAHNPRSNMNNGVGRAPLGWLGEQVALGTDGIGSDLFEEGRVGYFRRREEELATPMDWALARLAVGARLVGRAFAEPLLGRIEPGAPADLVVLDYPATTPLDASTLAGHWVFGLAAGHVRDVVVAGEVVVRDRRLARFDDAEVTDRARQATQQLWRRLEEVEVHRFAPATSAPAVRLEVG
jgi:putative selenium metabolism protein SsnA